MNKTIVRKKQQYINNNTVETYRNIPRSIAYSLKTDVAKGIASDALGQLGIRSNEQNRQQEVSGDLVEGQEITLKESPALRIEPGNNYHREIIHGHRKIIQENTQVLSRKIEEIIIELKRLIVASEELQLEFKEVAIEQRVVNPGKYHLSFFEWILSAIRLARMKIEDSSSWLTAFHSKKAKKQYWQMFKKHGTTFGLSNERVVATQTG